MPAWLIVLLVALGVLALGTLLLFYIVFRMAYWNVKKKTVIPDDPLHGKQYEPFYPAIRALYRANKAYGSGKPVHIKSKDGARLFASLYEGDSNVVDVLVHGYRSIGPRDMAGALTISREKGHTTLLVDQRGCGRSSGRTETFGVKERDDIRAWVDWINARYDRPSIVLTGVSLGAATVLMSLSTGLPENVRGIIADCPFESPRSILTQVARRKGISEGLSWFLLKGSALLYGHFNPGKMSALQAVKMSDVPVLLIHGTDDRYVPHKHSIHIQQQAPNHIRLELFEGAPHGMSYIVDEPRYRALVDHFYETILP